LITDAEPPPPAGALELSVFQKNGAARRFYQRHGFQLVRLTDGTGYVEQQPDAPYEWRQPSASWR
jgi:ribosomal protein S18 acetylase RimI-like enzyme